MTVNQNEQEKRAINRTKRFVILTFCVQSALTDDVLGPKVCDNAGLGDVCSEARDLRADGVVARGVAEPQDHVNLQCINTQNTHCTMYCRFVVHKNMPLAMYLVFKFVAL